MPWVELQPMLFIIATMGIGKELMQDFCLLISAITYYFFMFPQCIVIMMSKV